LDKSDLSEWTKNTVSTANKGNADVIKLSRSGQPPNQQQKRVEQIAFDRRELSEILRVYGYRVAAGEWEMPIFQVEKNPKLARKQGAYSVINAAGLILKRGHELRQVLKVLEPRKHLRVVD